MTAQSFKRMPELAALPLLAIIGTVFFAATDPRTVTPSLLMVGFIIIGSTIFCVLRLLMRLSGLRQRLKRSQYLGLLICGTTLPVMLLALQSLGQLTVRDVLVLVIVFAAGYFYVSRMAGRE